MNKEYLISLNRIKETLIQIMDLIIILIKSITKTTIFLSISNLKKIHPRVRAFFKKPKMIQRPNYLKRCPTLVLTTNSETNSLNLTEIRAKEVNQGRAQTRKMAITLMMNTNYSVKVNTATMMKRLC